MEDDYDLEEQAIPDEPFHVEADIYDTGDYRRLLIIPCESKFIVVANDEHLCTLVKSCDMPECWVQEDGSLEDEIVEKIGEAIQNFFV